MTSTKPSGSARAAHRHAPRPGRIKSGAPHHSPPGGARGGPARSLLPEPRIEGKTVYVLGTGFSAPLGLPVVAQFIPRGLSLLKQAGRTGIMTPSRIRSLVEDTVSLLHKYQSMLLLAQPEHQDPTVQDLFCVVDLLDGEPARRVLEQFLQTVCDVALSDAFAPRPSVGATRCGSPNSRVDQIHLRRDVFKAGDLEHIFPPHAPPGLNTVCAYVAFLSQVVGAQKDRLRPFYSSRSRSSLKRASQARYHDAIITFNYDLVLEKAAERFNPAGQSSNVGLFYGQGVGIPRDQARPPWLRLSGRLRMHDLPLLKLHGSFNWRRQKAKTGHEQYVVVQNGALKRPTRPGNLLVWPTWLRAPFRGVSKGLLLQALDHLRLASKIVIIGYSMPSTDLHVRYLLAQALNTPELPEVVICDYQKPETVVRQAWENLVGSLAKHTNTKVFVDGFVAYVRNWRIPHVTDRRT